MAIPWRFEFFLGGPFWAAAGLAALLVRLAAAWPRARAAALLACSSALLLALPRFGVRELALTWAVGAVSCAVALALVRPEGEVRPAARRALAALGVGVVLSTLALFKYRWVQEALGLGAAGAAGRPLEVLSLVGVSYLSFRAVHVVVDAYRRTLTELDPLTYLGYLTFFPAFLSGPIHRYPHFAAQLDAGRRGDLAADVKAAAPRIVHGLFKKVVLVQLLAPYVITSPTRPLAEQSSLGILVGLYAYAAFTYLDFSGYSDLAVGAARLLGLELPENFDRPFLRRNLRELWSSWHMSLTSWLLDYVYWPVVRLARRAEWLRARPVLLSAVGMNVTFLACGAWHGEGWNFLLWGAWHGLGLSALAVYQRQKRRLRSPRLQRYFASRASRVVGAIATVHYFTLGIALFALDLDTLRGLAANLLRQGAP